MTVDKASTREANRQTLQLTITITDIYDLVDPNMLIARWRSDAVGRDDKIVSWRGYANPEAAHAAVAKFGEDAQGRLYVR